MTYRASHVADWKPVMSADWISMIEGSQSCQLTGSLWPREASHVSWLDLYDRG